MIFRVFLIFVLSAMYGCTSTGKPPPHLDSNSETIIKRQNGEYLSLGEAIQVYSGGDKNYLELSWNIAEGYRLYVDRTKISYSGGSLDCEWTGLLNKETVPLFGLIRTAKIIATTKCRRPVAGELLSDLKIQYIGGAIDGRLLFPLINFVFKKAPPAKYYSGLVIQDLTKEIMNFEPAFAHGSALIHSVTPDSPADRAGIKRGDIVTAVNDIPVRTSRQFVYQLQSDQHDSLLIKLEIYRLENSFVIRHLNLHRELKLPEPLEDSASE